MTMFSKTSVLRIGAVILAGAALFGCRKDTPRTAAAAPGRPATDPTAVWRILFVNSYHEGYPWNEGLLSGAKAVLNEHTTAGRVELEVIRMDAKRNTSEVFLQEAARRAAVYIDMWQPDSVIAADDAASKYLISPYYRDGQLPVIFCGVNWDASPYGFPCANVTGILEISLIPSLLDTMRAHARGPRVGILGADNLSNRKEAEHYHRRFGLQTTREVFVTSMAQWKRAYIELQQQVDMLILAPPSFITSDTDKAQARAFIMEHTTIPTGSVEDWIAPYSLVCYAKDAAELGAWAARAALEIRDGRAPSDIPVATNQKARVFLNMPLARKLNVRFPAELVMRATLIEEGQP